VTPITFPEQNVVRAPLSKRGPPVTTTPVPAPVSDVDLFASSVLADPYDTYRRLRDAGPAVQLIAQPIWVLTRYADVRSGLADWETFTSAQGVALTDEMNAPMLGGVLATDPPEHDVLRSVLSEKLAPRALAKLRGDITERADALVATVVARTTFDAVTDLAQPLPVEVVADLIGLPREGREKLLPGADAVFASFGPLDERMQARFPVFLDYMQYMASVSNRSVLAPGSWGAAVFQAVDDGRIAEETAGPLLTAYLVAGMDTTVAAIAAYVRFLAEDPKLFATLKEDPSLVGSGFEETLRIESPVQGFFRNTTRAVDLEGTVIPAGSRVLLSNGSANRDERHYADPDVFDVHRNPVDHLAFGYATHGCAGQGLARIEARAIIESLLRRVDRIELAGEPVRHEHPVVRGLESVPVTVVPTAAG
jgi:cytochrome P450